MKYRNDIKNGFRTSLHNDLFPLPDSDSDSDSDFPNPVATLYYAEHVPNGQTWTRIWIWIPFPNGYYTHFRDGSPFQGQISIPITYILIRGSESESKPIEKSGIVQESVSESESESEYGNRNKPLD